MKTALITFKRIVLFALLMPAFAGMVACGGDDMQTSPAAAGTISGPHLIIEGGEPIELSIEEISGADTYRWYKDGMQVQDSGSRTLSVNGIGIYRVAGVNAVGEGRPSPDHVVALDIPEPTTPPEAAGAISGPAEVDEGFSIELTVGIVKDARTYKWYRNGEPVQNTSSRKLTVTEAGIYKVAGVNAIGEGAASPEHTVALIPAPLFIDGLVGVWDVTEWWAEGSSASINDHIITIAKIDDTTIEISNFNAAFPDPDDARDKVRAVIDNAAKTMTIPTNYEMPTWYDGLKTHIIPVIHANLSDNWRVPFPAQTFTKENGTLKMEMNVGDLTSSIGGVPYKTTYAVVAASGGDFTSEFGYALGTTWVKRE